MATNAAWSSPQMWRLAGALKALRREIERSKSILEASVLTRLDREANRLEVRRGRLVGEVQRMTDATPAEREALVQRVIQFYRDLGELERVAESSL